jgi:hypothetical protein
MEVDVAAFFGGMATGFMHFWETSFLVAFLKFFLFVYCGVLLINIILLFRERDVAGDLRMTLFQYKRPLTGRNKLIKRWEAILSRMESDNESQYKAALIEADAFADEVLTSMSYHGANMKERLDHIKEYQLETKAELVEAHNLRNRIINDPSLSLSKEEAEENLERYKLFFREIELFS